ncbi:J domain-containing protein (plasmid) [Skermanella mucosa]|uniref:J domain-containing protein n=1 Tax=Skermanella mucosa TaxID=1789672 RepID=UPI00192A8220|nr:J domain-containing protein [Skermanella mucosa]UEM25094.1 J domain-containing protein [Skermanella mucosa]
MTRSFRRRRWSGRSRRGALGEFGTLLRLVFGSAAATVAAYLDRQGTGAGPGASAALCRRELAVRKAECARLADEIRRYDKARDILIAQVAAEADDAKRAVLSRSLDALENRLTGWLDEHDALLETIARLEADLAFFDAASGAAGEEGAGDPDRDSGREEAAPPGGGSSTPDAATARHLAALGLTSLPANLADLKSAYRVRLKSVHPDVSGRPSSDDAARATVAFAELRRRFE